MYKVVLALTMALSATGVAAAQFTPCVYDASPPGELKLVTLPPLFPGAAPMQIWQRVPRWEPRDAWVQPAILVNPLDAMTWQFYMPTAGRCLGAFDSYVNTTAANELARGLVGTYTGIPMDRPTGDVEVWIMTPAEFDVWRRGRSTTTRGGSMGKSTGGRFEVSLEPGWYQLVISNKHSGFTGKVVSLQFGGRLPERR